MPPAQMCVPTVARAYILLGWKFPTRSVQVPSIVDQHRMVPSEEPLQMDSPKMVMQFTNDLCPNEGQSSSKATKCYQIKSS